jgi:hypothetical protein
MLNQDIVREATRFTRAGQLAEATALLQRMLRGESAPEPTSGTTARPCACRKSNSHIKMMKSAEKWRRQNATNRMYGSRHRRVLVD